MTELKFIDLILAVLKSHGESLRELSHVLGEEETAAILELAGDAMPESPMRDLIRELPLKPAPSTAPADRLLKSTPYLQIETAVREMRLPATLEFYVWTYPHYRALIESSVDLDAKFSSVPDRAQVNLIEEFVRQARAWVRILPMPPTEALKAEKAVESCWIRFRANVLPRLGAKAMRAVF